MDPLFVWKDAYFTEIDSVDDQHQRLVELINDLAAAAMDLSQAGLARIAPAREALLDYAQVHFADEEQMMATGGISDEHIKVHRAQHHSFIEEVRALDKTYREETLLVGLRYLMGWLAHHILGVDHSMARQLRAVKGGASAE